MISRWDDHPLFPNFGSPQAYVKELTSYGLAARVGWLMGKLQVCQPPQLRSSIENRPFPLEVTFIRLLSIKI